MKQPTALSEELEILKSPDKLDQPARIVKPRQKVFMLVLLIMILLTLAWSFITKIPVHIQGKGILIKESGISEVKTQFAGKIGTLHAKVGQHIEQGDILASVEQLDLTFEVRRLESQIRELKKNLDWLMDNNQPAKRQASIKRLQAQISRDQKALKGLDTSADTYEWETTELEKEIQANKMKLFDLENYREERIFGLRQDLLTYESEHQFKKNQLASQTVLVSPYSGTIIDMNFNSGDIFEKGSTFLVVENEDYEKNELLALLYVNAREGKKVKKGMPVQLAPTTIAAEEYGYMTGIVQYTSKYTLTEGGMNRVLRNPKVVEELSKEGLPMVVEIKLDVDSSTFSRYKWTTRSGPATEIISGTLFDGKIIADQKRPISFVVPYL